MQIAAASNAVALAGCTSEQRQAVNVDDPKQLDDVEDVSFTEEVSVGWINERFTENATSSNPAIGQSVQFRALVLTNLQAEEERLQLANKFQWKNFEFAGQQILGPLFKPVEWALDPAVELTEDFYEKFEMMKLVGVTEADQEFYNKYEFTPMVWATAPTDTDYYPSGTIIDVEGVIEYADQSTDWFAPGTDDGVYISIVGTEEVDSKRTLTRTTTEGSEATFTGVHHRDEQYLTTHLTDVTYEYAARKQFPKPAGGSLVTQTGTVTEKNFTVRNLVRDNSATLTTENQEIIVGDTTRNPQQTTGDTSSVTPDPTGDTGDQSSPTASTDGNLTNLVAVMDVSGSMTEADTRSGKSRIQVAKESAKTLVDQLTPTSQVGVVTFDTTAHTVAELQRAAEQTRTTLHTQIDDVVASGDTSITRGLEAGLSQLRTVSGSRSIVLLSDGLHNTGASVNTIIPELKSYGVTVYCIGMGDADRTLLRRLATETGGVARFTTQPSTIRNFYQEFAAAAQGRATLTSTTTILTDGESTTGVATVDESCEDIQFSLSYPGSRIRLDLTKPDGTMLDSTADTVTHRTTSTSEVWTIQRPQPGEWTYTAIGEQLERPEEATIEVNAASPVQTQLFLSDDLYDQTGMYRVEFKAILGQRRYTDANLTFTATRVDTETDTQTAMAATTDTTKAITTGKNGESGTEIELTLRDDGNGPDPVADDGIYTGYFHPPTTGTYELTAELSGGEYQSLSRTFTRELSVPETRTDPRQPYIAETGEILPQLSQPVTTAGLLGVLLLIPLLVYRLLRSDTSTENRGAIDDD